MASDRLVTPDHVLKSVMELERRRSTEVLSDLEKLEPELLEFVLESLTRLYHQLTDLGLSGKDARKAYRQAEKTTVVCILALRRAHHDLWQTNHGETDPPSDTPQ